MSTSSKSRWLEQISLKGFLSFGPEAVVLELGPLNVLIGSNGSGKSNFIEALAVLRSVPRDLPRMIRRGGGVQEFLWKGESPAKQAQISFVRAPRMIGSNTPALHYYLSFGASENQFTVLDERMWEETGGVFLEYGDGDDDDADVIYLGVPDGANEVFRSNTDPTQSILSQRQDPEVYPELSFLAREMARIGIYRNWSCGPEAAIRHSCRVDAPNDALAEGFDNLPARLLVLRKNVDFRQRTRELLADLLPGFKDVDIRLEGGQLQLYLSDGERETPSQRLSDGTLRFLALLAILLDPSPPPLVVIEEPELGLHPDMFPMIVDLLLEASERMQLVVTTHSNLLVDGLTEHPEAIIACDRVEGVTQLQRLDAERVAVWRKHGSLGQLWLDGLLGGKRW